MRVFLYLFIFFLKFFFHLFLLVWGCFWKRFNIWIGRLSKEDHCLDNVGGHHPIYWVPEYNKKAEYANLLSAWTGTSISPCPQTSMLSVFRLRLEFTLLTPLVQRPLDLNWNYTISLSGPPAHGQNITGLISCHNYVSQFLIIYFFLNMSMGFPGGSVVHARDTGLIPGSGRFPGKGNGSLFQYSYLENPMERGHKESDTS